MSGTCPRARCDNDKGLLHQSLTVGLPHFSFVPPIFSMPDSLLAIPDLTICRSADPQIPRSPDLQILILSTTSRSAMPGCDKIFWFVLPARRSDRCGKKRYLLWNWFFITLSHLQKRIAHSSRFDWRSVFKNKKQKKKPTFKTGSSGQFYASFSVTFNWKLLDLSPNSFFHLYFLQDQVEQRSRYGMGPKTERSRPGDHYLALSLSQSQQLPLIDYSVRFNWFLFWLAYEFGYLYKCI